MKWITKTINPNVAIVTDVCHDTTTPMIDKRPKERPNWCRSRNYLCSSGTKQLERELIIDTAEKNKIPFQRAASSELQESDTDAFAYSNGGVASALISLPLLHATTVEMVHCEDVENVIQLIYNTLLNMENDDSFSYFK